MQPDAAGRRKTITPLQREVTRAAAKHVPGAVLADPVAASAGYLLRGTRALPGRLRCTLDGQAAKNRDGRHPRYRNHELPAHLLEHPQGGTHSYWVYADLDNNAATGCPVSEPGRPEFRGAELRTLVTVNSTGTDAHATPTVWQCAGGHGWKSRIRASATAYESMAGPHDAPLSQRGDRDYTDAECSSRRGRQPAAGAGGGRGRIDLRSASGQRNGRM